MRTRLTLLLIVVPLIVWALFGFLGDRVSTHLSARFGSQILAHSDDKFTNAQVFVKCRLKEGVRLTTAACLLILAHRLLTAMAVRRMRTPGRWVVIGWSALICVNLFVAVAAHTVLFWSLLFNGKDHTHNYTQWSIKQGLMKESDVPGRAVLLGASQTRAQIDSKALNERLGRLIWTTELHFPGSTPYDMILCLRRLPDVQVDYIITYLSETNIYIGTHDDRLMYFFGVGELADYLRLGPGKPDFDHAAVCGLLGDVFPIDRVWEPLAGRMRGWEVQNAGQHRYDAALEDDLARRAEGVAKTLRFGAGSDFQKKAFTTFARMCRERHTRLIVCCGQLNPILERAMDPALRLDFIGFLREQAKEDANLVLLDGSQMPRQAETDYVDLTHVNLGARARFSQYIVDVLGNLSERKSLQVSY